MSVFTLLWTLGAATMLLALLWQARPDPAPIPVRVASPHRGTPKEY